LAIGQFKPVYWSPGRTNVAVNWERVIDEEGTVVHAALRDGSLELNLAPAISVFSQHHGKRLAASVYFEIAAKYAEKVGGTIVQRATVVGCKMSGQPQELMLANYPAMPMSFDRVCPGFRAVLQEAVGELEVADSLHGHPDNLFGHRHLPGGTTMEPAASNGGIWQPSDERPVCSRCGTSFASEVQLYQHLANHRAA
jgi:hypothetical protein